MFLLVCLEYCLFVFVLFCCLLVFFSLVFWYTRTRICNMKLFTLGLCLFFIVFRTRMRHLAASAPLPPQHTHTQLLQYYVSAFADLQKMTRIYVAVFAYLERHWIKREVDEGREGVMFIKPVLITFFSSSVFLFCFCFVFVPCTHHLLRGNFTYTSITMYTLTHKCICI